MNLPARRSPLLLLLLLVAALAVVVAPASALGAGGFTPVGSGEGTGQHGTISGTVPMSGMNVVLMEALPGGKAPINLGSTRSGRGGNFALPFSDAEFETVK